MQTNKWQKKYQPYQFAVDLPDRHWPNKVLQAPPIWCSVDLRDGNQALVNPMNLQQKLKLFQGLLNIGFKEIEVGFPAAAEVEYHFLRELIEKQLIPSDVSIQVLTQAREGLINRTVDSLKGCHSAIFHLYNSTSLAQRDMVFKMTKGQIKDIALQGVRWTKEALKDQHLNVTLQYSPESFTGTETEFALEVCESVVDEWNSEKPVIINLPSTVELSTPNVFADQIEWFLRKFSNTDRIILSVHNHNDRGTGVAASELAMLAGAQRVEGTLFGNGERTGNVDIVTLASNMMMHGLDSGLDFSNIHHIIKMTEECTSIPVPVRHPYAGDLVFTAFSGSHQDAIGKGMDVYNERDSKLWDVPYLPVDPADLGRTYEAIIRINSQSGKGGVAYVMETEFGCLLPKDMRPDFGKEVQKVAEKSGGEVGSKQLWEAFSRAYLDIQEPLQLVDFKSMYQENNFIEVELDVIYSSKEYKLSGKGNGPIDAAKNALLTIIDSFSVSSYFEHSLTEGSSSKAIAYIQVSKQDTSCFGVGIDFNINLASIRALVSAINRLFRV